MLLHLLWAQQIALQALDEVVADSAVADITGVLAKFIHRENSPVTETTPEPKLLTGAVDHTRPTPPTPHPTHPTHPHYHTPHTPTPHTPTPQHPTPPHPTPGHTASPVLSRHSEPIVLKPFDLAQACHGNKICPKLALTSKLTLELVFPVHCISN